MPEIQAVPKLTAVEGIKASSNGLAGTILENVLAGGEKFDDANTDLLKAHGTYQQDDRDTRKPRKKDGLEPEYIMMVRTRVPGGCMTPQQYLAFDDLADSCGNQTLRVTARQTIQFHHVKKANVKRLIKSINETRLSTLAACGDVNRNVMCCSLVDLDFRASLKMQETCLAIAEHFAPRSTAYWEIWCDGVKWGETVKPNRDEPLYGKSYMPRKFKMGLAAPQDNSVDLYTQDIGIEVVHEDGRLVAYDILAGGGMGYSHGKDATYPRLASRLVRCKPEQLIETLEGLFTIQRDFGDRTDRKHARFKYVVEERGDDWVREELFRRIGHELPPAGPLPQYNVLHHLGWHTAIDGRLYLGIYIENGRIQDDGHGPQRTGLRRIIEKFKPEVRLTPKQNVVLVGLQESDRNEIEKLLGDHNLSIDHDTSPLRKLAIACPAFPTCGLALAESERYMTSLLKQLEDAGFGDAPVDIRMTGCPNSCVRTPLAEIGVTGRCPGKYTLNLGGSQLGTRLNFFVKDLVTEAELPKVIGKLLAAWKAETGYRSSFGDWAAAKGKEGLLRLMVDG